MVLSQMLWVYHNICERTYFAISYDTFRKDQKGNRNGQSNFITNFMKTQRQVIIHTNHDFLRHLNHLLN